MFLGVLLSLLASDAPTPVVREIAIAGASVYDPPAVRRILRLREGDRLPAGGAAAVGAALEGRYHDDGYLAARVEAAYDEASGALSLAVDEGRLAAVSVAGLSPAASVRALRAAGLTPGGLLRRDDVEAAVERVERLSRGVLLRDGEPGYSVERTSDGVRLELHLRSAPLQVRPILLPPAGTAFYERVDGVAPWLGAGVEVADAAGEDRLSAYASGSWGFASADARYTLGARRSFAGERFVLGYELHDLTDTDDLYRGSRLQESLQTLLLRSAFRDYFRRRGHEAYAFLLLPSRVQVGVSFRRDTYESLDTHADGSLFHRSRKPRSNPEIDPGRMASLIASVAWSSQEPLAPTPSAQGESFLLRSLYGAAHDPLVGLRAEASFELAATGLGGDFAFHRFIGQLRSAHTAAGRLGLESRLLVGLTSGTPPAQKRFALGGRGTLSAFDLKEFPGSDMALASIDCMWHTRLLWPAPAVFYAGGVAWGPGSSSAGWRSDVGVGLRWPGQGHVRVRIDMGFALGSRSRSVGAAVVAGR